MLGVYDICKMNSGRVAEYHTIFSGKTHIIYKEKQYLWQFIWNGVHKDLNNPTSPSMKLEI